MAIVTYIVFVLLDTILDFSCTSWSTHSVENNLSIWCNMFLDLPLIYKKYCSGILKNGNTVWSFLTLSLPPTHPPRTSPIFFSKKTFINIFFNKGFLLVRWCQILYLFIVISIGAGLFPGFEQCPANFIWVLFSSWVLWAQPVCQKQAGLIRNGWRIGAAVWWMKLGAVLEHEED